MVFRQLFSVLARSCATRSILQADGIPIITFIKQYLHSFLQSTLPAFVFAQSTGEGFGKRNYTCY